MVDVICRYVCFNIMCYLVCVVENVDYDIYLFTYAMYCMDPQLQPALRISDIEGYIIGFSFSTFLDKLNS